MRKFFLGFLAAMRDTFSNELQSFLMLLLIFFSFQRTINCLPYKLKIANSLELASLLICGFTILAALIFKSDCSPVFMSVIAVMCVVFNLAFFVWAVFSLIYDIIVKYLISKKIE